MRRRLLPIVGVMFVPLSQVSAATVAVTMAINADHTVVTLPPSFYDITVAA